MSSLQTPIGWKTRSRLHHLKRVTPSNVAGMHITLHENINPQFLPVGHSTKMKTLTPQEAENIIYRQRVRGRLSGLPPPEKEFYLVMVNYSDDESGEGSDNSERCSTLRETECDTSSSNSSLESDSINEHLSARPGCLYTHRDIANVVERLSSYNPARIPESTSNAETMTYPDSPKSKKRYTTEDVDRIVKRLSRT